MSHARFHLLHACPVVTPKVVLKMELQYNFYGLNLKMLSKIGNLLILEKRALQWRKNAQKPFIVALLNQGGLTKTHECNTKKK
jgi:hypothetical protein